MNSTALTISDFCKNNKICRGTYYNLKKKGQAPREMRVGAKARITPEAEAEWRKRMEGAEPQATA